MVYQYQFSLCIGPGTPGDEKPQTYCEKLEQSRPSFSMWICAHGIIFRITKRSTMSLFFKLIYLHAHMSFLYQSCILASLKFWRGEGELCNTVVTYTTMQSNNQGIVNFKINNLFSIVFYTISHILVMFKKKKIYILK